LGDNLAKRYYREKRKYRIRRIYESRRRRIKEVGLFDLLGLGTGLGMSAFGPNGADYQNLKKDPQGTVKLAFNGIISGITGYDMQSKDWSASNLYEFWIPVVSFHIADWVFKKLGFNHVKIFKNIKLA